MRNRRTANPKGDSILSVNRRYNRAMTLMLGENEMPTEWESLSIDQLTVGERLELIEKLWNSLPGNVSREEVPDWHIAELEKRRRQAEEHPKVGRPWRDVLNDLGRE